MKLFIALIGLISLVPDDKGITALLPKVTAKEAHNAELGLEPHDRRPSRMFTFAKSTPTDILVSVGAPKAPVLGDYPGQNGKDRFIQFSRLLGSDDQARVDDDCLLQGPKGTCKGKLAARVIVKGPVTVLPVNFMIAAGSLKLVPSEEPWDRRYGFKDAVTGKTLSYQGSFSSAVFLGIDVPDAATTQSLEVGGTKQTVHRSPAAECDEYAAIAGAPAGKECFLVVVGNLPYHLDGPAHPGTADHFGLLTALLEHKPTIVPEMIWINEQQTGGDGFGTGPHTACPGGVMEAPLSAAHKP